MEPSERGEHLKPRQFYHKSVALSGIFRRWHCGEGICAPSSHQGCCGPAGGGGGTTTLPITSTAPGALESTGSILHAKWTRMVIGGHNNDIADWWVPETDPHPLPTNLPRLSLTPGRPPPPPQQHPHSPFCCAEQATGAHLSKRLDASSVTSSAQGTQLA